MLLLRHPRTPMLVAAHLCSFFMIMNVGLVFGLGVPHMPVIEGFIRPIITAAPGKPDPDRNGETACYSLRLHKDHRGVPVIYQFSIEVRQNDKWLEPIPVNAHLANDDGTPAADDFSEHPVGQTWSRRWCFNMPNSVASWQVIRIGGYAVHRVHPLWDTHTPLPSFVVAGTP